MKETLMDRRRARALAVGLVLAAVATTGACTRAAGDGPEVATSPTPTPSSATPTPTPTPTQLSPAEKDAKAAEQAVVMFWERITRYGANPNSDLTDLNEVAGDQALAQWQRNLHLLRARQQKYVGQAAVLRADATYDGNRVYSVKACVDVSEVNVIDKDGKSVVAANRQPRAEYTYKVTKIDQKFYVTEDKLRGKRC